MIRAFTILIILLHISACSTNANEIPFQKTQVEEEVKSMLMRYHESMNMYGLLSEFDFLDQSEDFFWVPPGYTNALNYESVERIIRKTDSTLLSVEFHWDTLSLYPLSHNLCNYTGKVVGTMVQKDSTVINLHVIESGSIIKRNDGWKLLSGQTSKL